MKIATTIQFQVPRSLKFQFPKAVFCLNMHPPPPFLLGRAGGVGGLSMLPNFQKWGLGKISIVRGGC